MNRPAVHNRNGQFFFDPTQQPTMKIGLFDLNWSLPSKIDENPMAWIVSETGFNIDVGNAPREIQEEA